MSHPPVSALARAHDPDIHLHGRNLTYMLENEHKPSTMDLKFMSFHQASADAAAAKQTPPLSIPVILNPDTPVASAADLQRLVSARKLPKTATVAKVDWGDIPSGSVDRGVTPDPVEVGFITGEQLGRLRERAHMRYISDDRPLLVHVDDKNGAVRYGVWVEALKGGVTLEELPAAEEGEEGGEEGEGEGEEEEETGGCRTQ